MRPKQKTRRHLLPEVLGRASYIDTVAVRLPRLLEKKDFRKLRLTMFGAQGTRKRRIVLKKTFLPPEVGGWYWTMYVHQPTQAALGILEEAHLQLTRVDIALDMFVGSADDAAEARDYVLHRIQRTARPVELSRIVEGQTAYVGQTTRRTAVLVIYADNRSKVNGQRCVHIELRLFHAHARRGLGLASIRAVMDLDHRVFWNQALRLRKPPSLDEIARARRELLRRLARPVREDQIERILRRLQRLCSDGGEGLIRSSDLLFLLREGRHVGRNPGRLFSAESHAWMLPEPGNALWMGAAAPTPSLVPTANPERATGCAVGASTPRHRLHNSSTQTASSTLHAASLPQVDESRLLRRLLARNLGNAAACPACSVSPAKFSEISGRRAFACQDCGHHLYPCAGTPLEGSRTSATAWAQAAHVLALRPDVRGPELRKLLGITYSTADRMLTKLREAQTFTRELAAMLSRRRIVVPD
jgi:transposase-like protein